MFLENYFIILIESNTINLEEISIVYLNASFIYKPKLIISHSTFYQNFGNIGGALFISQYETFIENSFFLENFGFDLGGAICLSSNIITIINTLFIRNVAEYGGAIYVDIQVFPSIDEARNLTITSSYFHNNLAMGSGGAIYLIKNVFDFTILIESSYFFKNAALIGGVFCLNQFSGNTTVFKSHFVSNFAEYGGGIYLQSNASCLFMNNIFIANAAIKIFIKIVGIYDEFFANYTMNVVIAQCLLSNLTDDFLISDPIFSFPNLYDMVLNQQLPSEDYVATSAIIGGVFICDSYVYGTSINSKQNLFKRNLALERGGVAGLIQGNFTDEKSQFIENSGTFGGVFDAEDGSNIIIEGSNFSRNSANT